MVLETEYAQYNDFNSNCSLCTWCFIIKVEELNNTRYNQNPYMQSYSEIGQMSMYYCGCLEIFPNG